MQISASMRDVLVEHIDGTPIVFKIEPAKTATFGDERKATRRGVSLKACISWGYIRVITSGSAYYTKITLKGREVLAAALADWAEALVRAGWDGMNSGKPLVNVAGEVPEAEELREARKL